MMTPDDLRRIREIRELMEHGFAGKDIGAQVIWALDHLLGTEWICEQHPELSWPHDDCAGPGMLISEQVQALVFQRDEARRVLAAVEYGAEAGACPSCFGKPHMDSCDLRHALRHSQKS